MKYYWGNFHDTKATYYVRRYLEAHEYMKIPHFKFIPKEMNNALH